MLILVLLGFVISAQIKSVAMAFGYAPEEIDHLADIGFAPEELEELLYCGEL